MSNKLDVEPSIVVDPDLANDPILSLLVSNPGVPKDKSRTKEPSSKIIGSRSRVYTNKKTAYKARDTSLDNYDMASLFSSKKPAAEKNDVTIESNDLVSLFSSKKPISDKIFTEFSNLKSTSLETVSTKCILDKPQMQLSNNSTTLPIMTEYEVKEPRGNSYRRIPIKNRNATDVLNTITRIDIQSIYTDSEVPFSLLNDSVYTDLDVFSNMTSSYFYDLTLKLLDDTPQKREYRDFRKTFTSKLEDTNLIIQRSLY